MVSIADTNSSNPTKLSLRMVPSKIIRSHASSKSYSTTLTVDPRTLVCFLVPSTSSNSTSAFNPTSCHYSIGFFAQQTGDAPPWTWFQHASNSSPPQPIVLSEMFNVMSLNNPSQDGWVMDTIATSHLHSNACILHFINDKSYNLPKVLVGNGSKIFISDSSHTFLSNNNSYRPLILKNINTPQIIKKIYFHL